jgi:hypothetical protein
MKKRQTSNHVINSELQDSSIKRVVVRTETDFIVLSVDELVDRFNKHCNNDIVDIKVFDDVLDLVMVNFSVGYQILKKNIKGVF